MAVQAIVDEGAGTALDRYRIVRIDVRAIEVQLFRGGKHGKRCEQQCKKQDSHDVTLSGSGLVRSILVDQGINRKNRKYRIVKPRATTGARSAPPSHEPNWPQTLVGSV